MKTVKTAALAIVLLLGCRTPTEPTTGKYVRPSTEEIGKPDEQPASVEEKDEDEDEDDAEQEAPPSEVSDQKPARPKTYVPEPEVPESLSFQETALARTVAKYGRGMAFKPQMEGFRCGTAEAIQASATYGAHDDWYTVVDCDDAVSAAHALSYRREITPFGTIDVSGVAIRHNGDDIWTLADVCEQMKQKEEACPSDFVAKYVEIKSMVGPVVSLVITTERSENRETATVTQRGKTLDGRTGQPAEFTAMITESSLLDALTQQTVLRRQLPLDQFLDASSPEEIFDLWRTQDFFHFGTYYFADWSPEQNRVEMRLQYLPEVTEETGELKELELWVEPRSKFKKAFEAAHRGEQGFYWTSTEIDQPREDVDSEGEGPSDPERDPEESPDLEENADSAPSGEPRKRSEGGEQEESDSSDESKDSVESGDSGESGDSEEAE